MKNLKKQAGFSLIEILIGLGIFAIIFVGVSYLLIDNLQASFDNQEKIKADFLVSEGLEAVKAIAGNDWDQVKPGVYGLAIIDNQWQLVAEPQQVAQMSKQGQRMITISDIDGNNIKKIESNVVWFNITDKLKQASVATLITNWRGYVSLCADGLDNDGDGNVDYPDDPGCSSPSDDDEYNPPDLPVCADGLDNDGDGAVDYPNDPGCSSANDDDETDPVIPPQCSDGLDNDGDGLIDYPADPGCDSANDNDENNPINPPQCSDGVDNDGDGFIDYPADLGCDSASDDDEANPVIPSQCSDGVDNDGDGFIDYPFDPGCDSPDDNDETDSENSPACIDNDNDSYNAVQEDCGPADCDDNNAAINPGVDEICDNGIDDNCNGLTDCQEPSCRQAANCQAVRPDVIFDDEDTPLCKLEEGTIDVTGKVVLPEGITAKLQLSYYIVWPEDKRTEITYVNKGSVINGDIFAFITPWPGVRGGDVKVETHIGAMLLDPDTGNPIMANGSSLDYYWYPWVCPPPQPECSDGIDNDGDGRIDYPEDDSCVSEDDNNEGTNDCGYDTDNDYIYACDSDDEDDEIEIKIKNNNNRGFSDGTISLPLGVVPLSPKDGDIYKGVLGTYSVEITNNPFYGIKFNTIGGEGFKNGAQEIFILIFSAEDYAKLEKLQVQAKSGLIIGEVIFNLQ